MDSILSVRINEEAKGKFLKLAEEQGINNKEFLDLIIKSYEMNKAAEDIDYIRNDIDELQLIVKRVVDIYVNIIDKNKVRTLELTNNFQANLNQEEVKRERLRDEATNTKKEIEILISDNKNIKESLQDVKSQLIKEKDDLKEYKEMNAILKDKLIDLNQYKSICEELKITNNKLVSEMNQAKDEKKSLLNEVSSLKNNNDILSNRLNDSESTFQVRIKDMHDNFNSKALIKDSEFSLLLQTQLLQKEHGLRQEIWNMKAEYDEKISKLMKEKEDLIFKISTANNNDNS